MKISRFFLLTAGLVFLGPAAIAQTRQIIQPDCVIDFVFTAAAQTAGGSGTCGNNSAGVYEWRLTYKSTGFSALSLLVQSAPDATGAPGTWVAFAGTVSGANPNTTITQNSSGFTGFFPWVRVLLSSVTGSGTITGQLYGCREPGCSIAGATINATIPTPVPVDGPTAAGTAPTTPPVLVAGQDGAPGLIRTIKTDSVGQLIPANAALVGADGISNTEQSPTGAAAAPLYYRILPMIYNGTTNDRQFSCLFQAVSIVAPGTTGQLILGSMGKTTKICHYHLSSSGSVNVVINSGTGTNCGAGTVQIDGYAAVTTFAMDFSPLSPLKAAAAGDDVCFNLSASVTATLTAIYAQY